MMSITITAAQASTLAKLCEENSAFELRQVEEGGDILVSRQGSEEPHFRISPDGHTHAMDL
jgi:hypothetical protein